MYTRKFLLLILLFVFAATLSATEEKVISQALIFRPIDLMIGATFNYWLDLMVEYQFAFHNYFALALQPSFLASILGWGYSARAGLICYLEGKKLEGFFLGFYGGMHDDFVINNPASYLRFSGVIESGWKFLVERSMLLSLGGGIEYMFTTNQYSAYFNFGMGFVW